MDFLLWVTVVVLAVALGYVIGRYAAGQAVVERVVHHTDATSPAGWTAPPETVVFGPTAPKMTWVQLVDVKGHQVARFEIVDKFRRSTMKHAMGGQVGIFTVSKQDADGTWVYRQVGTEKSAS